LEQLWQVIGDPGKRAPAWQRQAMERAGKQSLHEYLKKTLTNFSYIPLL
jgi:hypothetical protein